MRPSISRAMLLAVSLFGSIGCSEQAKPVPDISASAGGAATQANIVADASSELGAEVEPAVVDNIAGYEVLRDRNSGVLALSGEEAAWLDRNGYPTQTELDAWESFDASALDSAMRNRRDPKSAALLGHKLVMEGDLDAAVGVFSQGAYLGSLYSQQQLAIVSAERSTGLGRDQLADADPGIIGVMVSRLEVARMLGDHRAQALIDRYAANFNWNAYGKQVLNQTAILMDQYGEYARARGERVRGPDPRPNADAWANLEKDPNGLVTVYTRGRSWP